MLITPWFSFLHLAKTGGTFVKEILVAQYGDQVTVGYHDPWEKLPERQAPVLIFVRNPWDWYVSWFHYLQEFYARQSPDVRATDPVYRTGLGAGSHDFATAVRLACTGEIEVPLPDFQNRIVRHGDFYTAAFRYMVGAGLDDQRLTLGRMEHLRDDFAAFVQRTGAPDGDALVAAIRAARPYNESSRSHYRDYYDPELREVVRRGSSWMIERFGYTFD